MITPDDVQFMHTTVQQTMLDTCIIRTYTMGQPDGFGYAQPGFQETAPIRCGIRTPSAEEVLGEAEVTVETLILALPFTDDTGTPISIGNQDTIMLTHRLGLPLPQPQTYTIRKGPVAGATCWLLELTQVGQS